MNKSATRLILTVVAAACAAGLFVGSLKLPVWHLKMEAPQYQGQEALQVHVYPGSMSGDLREIKVLNHYIGVKIPDELPQLHWLPAALWAAAALGVGACFVPRFYRARALVGVAVLLSASMLFAAGQAQYQMHEIGHARDRHAPLKGVHDFTPPLLGSVKVANFHITASLGAGALLIGAGIVLQFGAGFVCRQRRQAPAARRAAPPPRLHYAFQAAGI